MYANFFGFRELPFNNTPDPRFFYSTRDHEEALASLIYAVKERKGYVLLTGEVGAGKTLVTRMMLRHFGTHIAFATINHAVQNPDDLMESIYTEFELPVKPGTSPTQLVRALHDYLLAQFAQNIPVVLVLDEAQNLPVEGFEQLRMVGNVEADDAKLLQVAIVGQPELQRMFLSPALRQLRQRIFRSFHLPALSRQATEGYIRHRLAVVTDHCVDIFDGDALEAIYGFSRGLPRIINTLCDNALLSAYSADRRTIDGPFIQSVIAQMMVIGGRPDREESIGKPSAWQPSGAMMTTPGRPSTLRDDWPEYDTDPAQASPVMKGVSSRVQSTPRRMPDIQTQSHASTVPDDDVTRPIRGELAALEQYVRSNIDTTTRRVSKFERWLNSAAPGDLAEARAIRASLEQQVQQARPLVGRAETASQQLKQRDGQLRKLAATIKNVVRDLRHLLNRAHEVATKGSIAERNARSIYDRLVVQSERSRKLADELAQIFNRTMSTGSTGSEAPSQPLLLKECSVPVGPMRSPLADVGFGGSETDKVQQALESTRESLSSLRSLARDASNEDSTPYTMDPGLATGRLAHQVENLLEIIESGQNATACEAAQGLEATAAKNKVLQ